MLVLFLSFWFWRFPGKVECDAAHLPHEGILSSSISHYDILEEKERDLSLSLFSLSLSLPLSLSLSLSPSPSLSSVCSDVLGIN